MANGSSSRHPYYLGIALAAILGAAALFGAASPSGLALAAVLGVRPAAAGQESLCWNWLPVVAKPQPTPTLTPTATSLPPILDIRVDKACFAYRGGSAQDPNGEYVCFRNYDWRTADMTGWRLEDATGHTYVFPRFVLAPGAVVYLHSGPGANTATDLYWGRGLVWNNDHDVVCLWDAFGRDLPCYVY